MNPRARERAAARARPAAAWPPSTAAAGLRQAGVYDQIVTGHAARLVGCQEQRAARDVVADEPEFQALLIEKLPFQLRRAPQCALPRRIDRSGHDRIDADVVWTQLARQRARQAANCR